MHRVKAVIACYLHKLRLISRKTTFGIDHYWQNLVTLLILGLSINPGDIRLKYKQFGHWQPSFYWPYSADWYLRICMTYFPWSQREGNKIHWIPITCLSDDMYGQERRAGDISLSLNTSNNMFHNAVEHMSTRLVQMCIKDRIKGEFVS